jgi:hypothetical protein
MGMLLGRPRHCNNKGVRLRARLDTPSEIVGGRRVPDLLRLPRGEILRTVPGPKRCLNVASINPQNQQYKKTAIGALLLALAWESVLLLPLSLPHGY